MNKKIMSVALISAFLTGCASSGSTTQSAETNRSDIPVWVFTPSSANGLSASSCAESSGSFAIDRNHAISLARNSLAQNLSMKANVLEKTYQNLDTAAGQRISGSSFEQVAKKMSSVAINNSQVEQIALTTIDGVKQVCALVNIPKKDTDSAFDGILDGAALDPTDKAAMYQEFIKQRSEKELEAQLKTLTQ